MEKTEIQRWARMFHDFLMVEREGTVEDVFAAADAWIGTSRFFPTVSDLVPHVTARVLARREQAMIAAAQREARPLPALPDGEVDWSKVRTADLPPGYDYSQDIHWQRGMELLGPIMEGKPAMSPLGKFVGQVYQRMQANREVGFQGASKEREVVCPDCKGARWVRLGGWDGHPNDIGHPGSQYVACATCCPGGRYSELAGRDAARRKAAT